MDKLHLEGVKRICMEGDPNRIIEFNPTDILFVEKFYKVYQDFQEKITEYDKRSKELDAKKDELTENGMPKNVEEGVVFVKEVCGFMRERIDYLFGEGTSQIAFGDALSLEMIGQFFEGLIPFIMEARKKELNKYSKIE